MQNVCSLALAMSEASGTVDFHDNRERIQIIQIACEKVSSLYSIPADRSRLLDAISVLGRRDGRR